MAICEFCHKELVNANAYEDGLYGLIGSWLCEVTCLPWYKFNPNLKKPTEQYGMMFFKDYQTKHQSSIVRQIGDDLDTANFCLAVEETETFTMDLNVLQEQGDPVRCDQLLQSQFHRSTSDVIKQVNSLVVSQDFNKPLKEAGIRISKTDSIMPTLNERDGVWENWAEASFPVVSCRKTSYPLKGDELVYCVALCDGTPICRVREFPECV